MNCLRATERSPRFHDEAEEAGERGLFIEESLKKKKQGSEKEPRGRKKISEFPSCPRKHRSENKRGIQRKTRVNSFWFQWPHISQTP